MASTSGAPWPTNAPRSSARSTQALSTEGMCGYAHVEDAKERKLLFAGTELGLFISVDGGGSWAEFKGGDFPSVVVRDVQVQGRDGDLVLATHGRGIWIVDDLTPLRALAAGGIPQDFAFLPGRPVQERFQSQGGCAYAGGDAIFVGRNLESGAVISYYQRAPHLFGSIKLEVLDAKGKVVDTLRPSVRGAPVLGGTAGEVPRRAHGGARARAGGRGERAGRGAKAHRRGAASSGI